MKLPTVSRDIGKMFGFLPGRNKGEPWALATTEGLWWLDVIGHDPIGCPYGFARAPAGEDSADVVVKAFAGCTATIAGDRANALPVVVFRERLTASPKHWAAVRGGWDAIHDVLLAIHRGLGGNSLSALHDVVFDDGLAKVRWSDPGVATPLAARVIRALDPSPTTIAYTRWAERLIAGDRDAPPAGLGPWRHASATLALAAASDDEGFLDGAGVDTAWRYLSGPVPRDGAAVPARPSLLQEPDGQIARALVALATKALCAARKPPATLARHPLFRSLRGADGKVDGRSWISAIEPLVDADDLEGAANALLTGSMLIYAAERRLPDELVDASREIAESAGWKHATEVLEG